MSFSFSCSIEANVLVASAEGEFKSVEEIKRYTEIVLASVREHGLRRVLCLHERVRSRLNVLDIYIVSSYLAQRAPRVVRVAMTVPQSEVENAQFWETVALNRGLRAKVFTDADRARKWLDE